MGIILAPGEVLEVVDSPIAREIREEMARRQKLADARAADPNTDDLWDGSSTQRDIDSHEFPISEGCGVFCDGCYLRASGECNCCGDCPDCDPLGCDEPIDGECGIACCDF